MATSETRSVELDPLTPSFDGDLAAVDSELNQVGEADTRELSAYSFDSVDKTLVGVGTSGGADSSTVRHFDSSDRTLVGIGPAERAKRAKRARAAELASYAQQAELAPECVPMPHSEPPGPFVAGADDEGAPERLPRQKGAPWVLALSALLLAAATVVLLRGVVSHTSAPRLHSATTVAPLATAHEIPITQAPEAPQPAPPPATAQREKQPELAPRRVTTKSAASEPLGALDISSNPPSGVVLDGRPLGKAPLVIQLPSGSHTVLFVHPERGRMSVTVNVRAGRTTSASADF